MGKLSEIGRPPYPQERRKHPRFSLRYPVDIKFDFGDSVSELRAVSNNISLGGVLLEADSPIPQRCAVSFVVTVQRHDIVAPTQLVGEGAVVRVEPRRPGARFAIAVKCKRPISKVENRLPAATG